MQLIKYQHGVIHKKQQGFTMIEVLVSVLLASVGLMGVAGLQVSSVNMATVAYTDTQAVVAMQDMVELLKSSHGDAKGGNYNIAADTKFTDLADLATGSSQADKSVYYWLQNLSSVLPNVKAQINCDTSGDCEIKMQYSNVDSSTNSSIAMREQIVTVKL